MLSPQQCAFSVGALKDSKQERRDDREGGAGQECRARRHLRPDEAEQQARRQAADAERGVIHPECRSPPIGRRQVRDPRLLGPLGESAAPAALRWSAE